MFLGKRANRLARYNILLLKSDILVGTMTKGYILSALLLAMMTGAATASANKEITGTVATSAGSPAEVLYCHGGHWSGLHKRILMGVDFQSTTATLKAVEVRIDLYDAFGTYLAGITEQDAGKFAVGSRIRHSGSVDQFGASENYTVPDLWPNAKSMKCSIAKTLDLNGNVWANPFLPSPPPSPNPAY